MARCLVLPAAWLVLLGLSVALSVLAAQHDTLPGDTRIITWAQGQAFPGAALSNVVRAVTTTEAVLGTGGAVVVTLWLLGHRRPAVLLAIGLVVLPLLQAGLKELVDRPRPEEPVVELRAGFSSLSFPAGHVMSPTLLYGFLLYLSARATWPPALRLVTVLWSAFVLSFAGPPNVWLGVHWPSDVLGGWAWALVLLVPLLYAHDTMRPIANAARQARCRPR